MESNPILFLNKNNYKEFEVLLTSNIVKESFPVHFHDFVEIEIVTGGDGIQNINGKNHHIKRGDAYILRPLDFHSVEVYHTITLHNIKVNEFFFSDFFSPEKSNIINDCFASFDDSRFDLILSIVAALEYELQNLQKYSKNLIQNLLEYLFISITQNIKETDNMLQNNQLRSVLLHINKNYKSKMSLEESAKICGYSPAYFSDWFHKKTGKAYTEYINDLRLSEAQKLLFSTSLSVKEVGFASGFSSFPNFLKEFKKKYDTTPTGFRNKVQIWNF